MKMKMKMKKNILMIIPALICGIVFTSCEKTEQNEQKPTDGLYVIGVKSVTLRTSEESNLVFTDDDIISFDVATGEIVFIDRKVDEIISRISLYSELNFIIDDKPVFVPSIPTMHFEGNRFCASPLPWAWWNDLGLLILNSKACYLTEGYLPWHFLSSDDNDREAILKQQEENSEKRKKELEVFIEYLRETGKIIE